MTARRRRPPAWATYDLSATLTNANYQADPITGTLTVQAEAIHGNIVSSLARSYYGQEVTLTATFYSTPAGSAPMTGTVAFYDGNTYLGTEPLIATVAAALPAATPAGGGRSSRNQLIATGAAALPAATVFMADASPMVSGTSSLPTSSLSVGNHIITAVYSGDARYSAATVETPVSVEVVAAVTSTTLTASTTAQGTTLIANVVVTSPGNPPVVGSVSFYDGSTLLGTEPVSNGVATLSVGALAPGSHSFSAVFSGSGTVSASTSSLVVSTDGPLVTGLRRYGFHWQPTYLLLNFNGPLDPTSAQNASNYQILGPGGHRIMVVSAIYDPATQTVTLVPAERLNIHWEYSLTVNGAAPSGLTNPSGVPLDGSGKGHVGSNYVTSITWRNLAGQASTLPTYALVHKAPPPRPAITHTQRRVGWRCRSTSRWWRRSTSRWWRRSTSRWWRPQHVKVVAAQHAKVVVVRARQGGGGAARQGGGGAARQGGGVQHRQGGGAAARQGGGGAARQGGGGAARQGGGGAARQGGGAAARQGGGAAARQGGGGTARQGGGGAARQGGTTCGGRRSSTGDKIAAGTKESPCEALS